MNSQIQKAIRIIKRTGDRLIIVDASSDESYVVMNLDEYEKMLKVCSERNQGITESEKNSALTEEKLIDKINRDIALWKSQQSGGLDNEEGEYSDFLNSEGDDDFYFNKPNITKKKKWRIPSNVKQEAEEIIDEDAQYLEGTPF